jgi:exodeoxyribonuclease V alpha subunit
MGGPGTGKTYTISRILSANLSAHQAESDLPFKVALAAPTAKAAARMRESMTDAVSQEGHPFPEVQVEVLAQLEPLTIHRLLGYRPGSGTRFAHDEKKPLDFDLIIIDEMSMVSMPLMARLLEAVDPRTRLVLVGDPGQLASVENGSILPDLSQLESRFSHSTTTLEISRRNSQSSSSDFTSAVRHGDSERALGIIDTKPDETLKLIESNDGFKGAESQIGEIVKAFVIVQQFASSNRFVDALEATNRMRVVCAHRNGNYGVAIWNKEIAKSIHKKRLNWNVGDIVVKTRNDIANGLSNGENGVVVGQGNDLMFAFRRGSEIVERPVSSVDDVELAYATTVHKAQGSEFGTVVVVVPPKESPLCTRELLYTAATRAKPNLVIIGSRSDIEHAIENQRPRYSGLVDRLRAL